MAEHSPLPWEHLDTLVGMFDDDHVYHAVASCRVPADAEFICRAVNSHAELLAALKACERTLFSMGREFAGPRFTDRHGDGPRMLALAEAARDAIAKAEGVR